MRKMKEEREKEKAERARRFPGARLDYLDDDLGVILEIKEGEPWWITVRSRGEWPLEETIGGWRRTGIVLNQPDEIIAFIRALVARYNALIERANEIAVDVNALMAQTVRIPAPPESGNEAMKKGG